MTEEKFADFGELLYDNGHERPAPKEKNQKLEHWLALLFFLIVLSCFILLIAPRLFGLLSTPVSRLTSLIVLVIGIMGLIVVALVFSDSVFFWRIQVFSNGVIFSCNEKEKGRFLFSQVHGFERLAKNPFPEDDNHIGIYGKIGGSPRPVRFYPSKNQNMKQALYCLNEAYINYRINHFSKIDVYGLYRNEESVFTNAYFLTLNNGKFINEQLNSMKPEFLFNEVVDVIVKDKEIELRNKNKEVLFKYSRQYFMNLDFLQYLVYEKGGGRRTNISNNLKKRKEKDLDIIIKHMLEYITIGEAGDLRPYTLSEINECERILIDFVDRLIKLGDTITLVAIQDSVKGVVLALNELKLKFPELIETEEREMLCEFIENVAVDVGLPLPAGDITQRWRKW